MNVDIPPHTFFDYLLCSTYLSIGESIRATRRGIVHYIIHGIQPRMIGAGIRKIAGTAWDSAHILTFSWSVIDQISRITASVKGMHKIEIVSCFLGEAKYKKTQILVSRRTMRTQ